MTPIYAITLSDENIILQNNKSMTGTTTDLYSIWFVSYNKELTEKIINYFENVDYNYYKDIINPIMMCEEITEMTRPLFKIMTFDNENELRKNFIYTHIDTIRDTIFPEGLSNMKYSKTEQQQYNSTHINSNILNKIRVEFNNLAII